MKHASSVFHQSRRWSEQQAPLLWQEREAYGLHTGCSARGAYRSLPSLRFLHPLGFSHVSPPRAEAAVTYAGTAVPYLEGSWLNSHLYQLAREHLHFQAITHSDFTERTSIIQHYSVELIIIQNLFSASFASSQACTGAWLTLHHKFPLSSSPRAKFLLDKHWGYYQQNSLSSLLACQELLISLLPLAT